MGIPQDESAISQMDDDLPRLAYVEPLAFESISHYLGRLRRFKANSLPSAYSLGQAAGIGAVIGRWEKLYFNPFPTEQELEAIARITEVNSDRLREMLPCLGVVSQPRPIRLCGVCYGEIPCHRMDWQHKDAIAVCPHHHIRLLERCPSCKSPFKIPALWVDGRCDRCEMRFTLMVKFQGRIKKTSRGDNR
jgi:hypothetical protein